MKFFYKIIYFIRKKSSKLILDYYINESKALFHNRITIDSSVMMNQYPKIKLDQSNSQIIVKSKVVFLEGISLLCYQNAKLIVNENSVFNNGCSINCIQSIVIGSNCLIGENVKLYDHNHQFKDRSKLVTDQGFTSAPIIIGNNVWIGSDVVILKGVSIGDNCVIGAGCVVTSSISANKLVTSQNSSSLTIKEIHA